MVSQTGIHRRAAARALGGLGALALAMGLILFGVSGSLDYPGAWALMACVLGPTAAIYTYFLAIDPSFLLKRLVFRGSSPFQTLLEASCALCILALIGLPALGRRLDWPGLPSWAVFPGAGLVSGGYALLFAGYRHNRFAARSLSIQDGQSLADTGPYALLRHPVYAAAAMINLGTPLILGSAWGYLAAPPLLGILITRILSEEAFLYRRLPGYADYMRRVRWRLIHGLW